MTLVAQSQGIGGYLGATSRDICMKRSMDILNQTGLARAGIRVRIPYYHRRQSKKWIPRVVALLTWLLEGSRVQALTFPLTTKRSGKSQCLPDGEAVTRETDKLFVDPSEATIRCMRILIGGRWNVTDHISSGSGSFEVLCSHGSLCIFDSCQKCMDRAQAPVGNSTAITI